MGYFKIELIHKDGTKYWTEWELESDECDSYTESQYIDMMKSLCVHNMTEIEIFDSEDNLLDLGYEGLNEFKKSLTWGKVLEIDID